MRIMIIKSTSNNYWYNSIIGYEFNVIKYSEASNCYIVSNKDMPHACRIKFPSLTNNLGIFFSDAVVIEDLIDSNNISELFEEKVRQIRGFVKGDKVHYKDWDRKQNGIVKSFNSDGKPFVVYDCADDWENYEKYTGILTDLEKLKLGWYDNIHDERDTFEGI